MTFSSTRDLPWRLATLAAIAVLAVSGALLIPQAAFAAAGEAGRHRSATDDLGGTRSGAHDTKTHVVKRHRAANAARRAVPSVEPAGVVVLPGHRQARSARSTPLSPVGSTVPPGRPGSGLIATSPGGMSRGTGEPGKTRASSSGGSTGSDVAANCAINARAEFPSVTVSAAWADTSIRDHDATTLRITLHKPFTCSPVSGVGYQVTLPATLYVTTGTPTSTCAGTLAATLGSNSITLSSTTLGGPATDCVVEVPVSGSSSGLYTLTAASFTSLTGVSSAVTDQQLTVTPAPLVMYGYFNTSPIDALATSALNLVLYRTDQNTTALVSGVGFRLTLPAGLNVASGTQTNTCAGSLTASSGATAIVLAGAGLNVSSSTCTLSVEVTSSVSGSYSLQNATVSNAAAVASSLGDYCLTAVSTARTESGCAPALQVNPLTQTIAFAQPADASVSKHTAPLTATATSGLPVAFSSATVATCSVSAATVTLLSPGTCTVDAHQAGNGTYAVAPVESQSFVIGAATPPPNAVTAAAGVSSVVAHWQAPSDLTGVTGYTAIASPGPATCSTDGALSCVLGGTAGVTYTITVIARNSLGDSAAAGPSGSVTPTQPPISTTMPVTSLDLTTDKGLITTAQPKQQVVIIGTGFAAYSTATIVIYSRPVVLGTVTTDTSGNFRTSVTIPAGLTTGRHTMIAAGVGPNGAAHYLSLSVRVRADSADGLAATGAPITTLALLGLASVLSGGGLILTGRARRRKRDERRSSPHRACAATQYVVGGN